MKDKPTKWGVKVWVVCDAEVHYCLNFEIYTGGTGEKGLSFNVVNQLMSRYLEKGHRLYTDNFYTPPSYCVTYWNTKLWVWILLEITVNTSQSDGSQRFIPLLLVSPFSPKAIR